MRAGQPATRHVRGKEYVVEDGDCMHFRFNVTTVSQGASSVKAAFTSAAGRPAKRAFTCAWVPKLRDFMRSMERVPRRWSTWCWRMRAGQPATRHVRGKEYVVEDGGCMHFRFNVTT